MAVVFVERAIKQALAQAQVDRRQSMNFEHSCTIPVARQTLWDFLMDVPQMAVCVPGVSDVSLNGEDQYAGKMKVKFGPIPTHPPRRALHP